MTKLTPIFEPAPTDLLSPRAVTHFWWPPLQRLGAAPVFRGGFELNTKSGVVDVQQCLTKGETCSLPGVQEWPAESDTCWLELDQGGDSASYFYSLPEDAEREQALSRLFHPSTIKTLLEKGRLCYVGVMSGRPGGGVRAVFEERLDRLEGMEAAFLRRLLPPEQELRPCFDLQDTTWSREVGFEFRPSSDALPTFLQRAQGEGLLSEEQMALVKAWAACVPPTVWWLPRPVLEEAPCLPVFRRSLSHFKLVFAPPDDWTLKVYLYFQLENWKGRAEQGVDLVRGSVRSGRSGAELSVSDRSLVKEYLSGTLPPEMESRLELWNYAFGVRWWMRYLSGSVPSTKV